MIQNLYYFIDNNVSASLTNFQDKTPKISLATDFRRFITLSSYLTTNITIKIYFLKN